jgi:signal transduction histidine kinase
VAPLLSSIEPVAKSRGMRLENNVDPALEVQADRNMIREVFENLLSNAVKYGREGGVVRIDAQGADGAVNFQVFNEGEGIPEDKLGALFQKFSRLAGPSPTHPRGTGLGLFITKHRGARRADQRGLPAGPVRRVSLRPAGGPERAWWARNSLTKSMDDVIMIKEV